MSEDQLRACSDGIEGIARAHPSRGGSLLLLEEYEDDASTLREIRPRNERGAFPQPMPGELWRPSVELSSSKQKESP
jgi:hypothetical protein